MGQNDEAQTLGAKVQFWKVLAMVIRPAAILANPSNGLHEKGYGQHLL